MATTNEIGSQSEAMMLALMIRAGYSVLVPYNVLRYDLAFDEDGALRRVQVKTGRLRSGAVLFNNYSVQYGTTKKYTEDEVDYFGIYCHELGRGFLVPFAEVPPGRGLRWENAKSNQTKRVTWAHPYEIKT